MVLLLVVVDFRFLVVLVFLTFLTVVLFASVELLFFKIGCPVELFDIATVFAVALTFSAINPICLVVMVELESWLSAGSPKSP